MAKYPSLPTHRELALTVLLAALSIAVGLSLQISVPGIDVDVSFFEIPLLIGLIHFRSVISILLMSLLSTCIVFAFPDLSYLSTFVSHFVSLGVIWYLFGLFGGRFRTYFGSGLLWFILVVAYYFFLLVPLILLHKCVINQDFEIFSNTYIPILSTIIYEMVPTVLVSTFYLIQHEMRAKLVAHKESLEQTVAERTAEISNALAQLKTVNKELNTSNDEVRQLNENLEKIVAERTEKINKQLEQLQRYARLNAHDVRAPLARILSLGELLKMNAGDLNKEELIEKIHFSALELDEIIRRMNELLTEEKGARL